jgi:hypothetical protein
VPAGGGFSTLSDDVPPAHFPASLGLHPICPPEGVVDDATMEFLTSEYESIFQNSPTSYIADQTFVILIHQLFISMVADFISMEAFAQFVKLLLRQLIRFEFYLFFLVFVLLIKLFLLVLKTIEFIGNFCY